MFFHFWQLTGDFIENFPYDRCEHCTAQWLARYGMDPKAREVLKLYEDALDILSNANDISVNATVGIFDARSTQDDIIFINGTPFPMLRRQQPNDKGECLSLADFVKPEGLGGNDYVGAFAVSVRADGLLDEYAAKGDKYSEMLLRSLLDRLAEAGSEYLHRYVRCEKWGYDTEENLSTSQLLTGEFRGIRPAMGYPMTPDQLLNHQIARLLPFDEIGISITENGAMTPTATVSGLYIAHPYSRYFMIGKIGDDQLRDYSLRRNIPEEKMKKILNKNL